MPQILFFDKPPKMKTRPRSLYNSYCICVKSISGILGGFKFPQSCKYYDYPEIEYCNFIKHIEIISNEKISNNEKWDKKFELIKSFIIRNKRFPYWFERFLGNIHLLKTESLKTYRTNKMMTLTNCNFIKSNGSLCNKYHPCDYKYRKDPFKCYFHSKRCPNCEEWVDSQAQNKKFDNYCARCFKRLFPDDPRSLVIYEHSKEIMVRNAISLKAVDNIRFRDFIHDTPIYTGECDCTHRRRIDHRKLIGNTIIAIETDEHGHKSYDSEDERIRYDDLYMIHSGKWIYIRFNPDNTKTCKIDLKKRIILLLELIEKTIIRIENEENTDLVEVIKLFYD